MRSTNLAKNVSAGLISRLISVALNFIARTIFIYSLPQDFLGINGLFTSIFAFLNLSELGLGSAIIYALYKPLAEKDDRKIWQLMRFYRRAYVLVGCMVAVLGVALLPALPYLAKGSTTLVDMNAIYLFFLFETITSYWFWAYKSSVLTADQKEYVAVIIRNKVDVAKVAVRIIFLLCLKDDPALTFYVYVFIGILFTIVSNWLIGKKVDKLYPVLQQDTGESLPAEERKAIFKNVFGMSLNRISAVVNNALDTVLVSAFLGLTDNGILSNYDLLISIISSLLWSIVTALIPAVGEINIREDAKKKEFLFRCIGLVLFWIYGFCGISLWMLLNPFIGGIWLNGAYLLPEWSVAVLYLNFVTGGCLAVFGIFLDATGQFAHRGVVAFISALTNAVLSVLILVFTDLGIGGVVLATVCARMLVVVPCYVRIVAKYVFNKKSSLFYVFYYGTLVITLVTGLAVYVMMLPFETYSLLNFVIKAATCLGFINGSWFLIFRKTPEFAYVKQMARAVYDRARKSGIRAHEERRTGEHGCREDDKHRGE